MPGPGIIVFTDNNGNIQQINPDGTGLTQILSAPLGGFWWTIDVSQDGNSVITTMQTPPSTFTLWMMSGGGIGQLTNIDSGTPLSNGGFWSFNPDASKVVGLAHSVTGVQIVNTDNSGFDLITIPNLDTGASTAVLWSPDGSTIAYPCDDGGGNPTFGTMNPDGTGQAVQVSGSSSLQYAPFDWYSDSANLLVSKTTLSGAFPIDVIKWPVGGSGAVLFTDATEAHWGNWPAVLSLDDLSIAFGGDTMGGPHPMDVWDGATVHEYSLPSPGTSLNQMAWTSVTPPVVPIGTTPPAPPLGIIASGDSLAGVVRLG